MLIVNPATGAMWRIDNPVIQVRLNKTNAASQASLQILEINDVPDNLKMHPVKVK